MSRISRPALPLHLRVVNLLLCFMLAAPPVALSRAADAGRKGLTSQAVAAPVPYGPKEAGRGAPGSALTEEATTGSTRGREPAAPRASALTRQAVERPSAPPMRSPLFARRMSRVASGPARPLALAPAPVFSAGAREVKPLPVESVKAAAGEAQPAGSPSAEGGVEAARDVAPATDKASANKASAQSELLGGVERAATREASEGRDAVTPLRLNSAPEGPEARAEAVSPAALSAEGVEAVAVKSATGALADSAAAEPAGVTAGESAAAVVSPLALQPQAPPQAAAAANNYFDVV
jgi:hypothetical protein